MTKNSKYFIPYEGAFLMNSYRLFRYKYTPWIYVYLKNTFYYDILKNPTEPKKIKRAEMTSFFNISYRMLLKSFEELEANKLMSKTSKDHYYIVPETKLISDCKDSLKEYVDTKNSFFQMKYNFFFKFYPMIGYPGFYLYYYMKILNQHYFSKEDTVKIDDGYFTIRKFCKEMKFAHRTISPILEKMVDLNILMYDQFGNYYTHSEKKILS